MQVLQKALMYVAGSGQLQIQLADHVAATAAGCRVCLLREGVPASAPERDRVKQIPLGSTIEEAIWGQLIIEFPRFRVSLLAHDVP